VGGWHGEPFWCGSLGLSSSELVFAVLLDSCDRDFIVLLPMDDSGDLVEEEAFLVVVLSISELEFHAILLVKVDYLAQYSELKGISLVCETC